MSEGPSAARVRISKLRREIPDTILRPFVSTTLAREKLERATRPRWEALYGTFQTPETISAEAIGGLLRKASGSIRAEIVSVIDDLRSQQSLAPLLLPGENNLTLPAYESWLGLDRADIVTAGLGDNFDVPWDFEDDPPPALRSFRAIISQAMIEHLLDPYKHVRDLYGMLDPGGVLVIHTVTPGFPYHRHPIDCVRFYPDWFEVVADRLGCEIVAKFVGDSRIMYAYKRP